MWRWSMWVLLGVLVLSSASAGYRLYTRDGVNARVAAEIRQYPNGERARHTMLITLADGRMYPVNYLRDGKLVYMGIDGRWWRAYVGEGEEVSMLIRGEVVAGHARTVLDQPDCKAAVFSRLRPTVPVWLPEWLDAKLVEVTVLD